MGPEVGLGADTRAGVGLVVEGLVGILVGRNVGEDVGLATGTVVDGNISGD